MAKPVRYEGEPIRPETITFEEVQEARKELERWTEFEQQVNQVRERCFADEKRAQSRLEHLKASLPGLLTKVAFGEAERREFDEAEQVIRQCQQTIHECDLLKPGITSRAQQVTAMLVPAQKMVADYELYRAGLLREMQDRLDWALRMGYADAVKHLGESKLLEAMKFANSLLHEEKRLGRETAGLKHGLDAISWAHRVRDQVRSILAAAKAERPPEDLPLQQAKQRLGDLAAWVS